MKTNKERKNYLADTLKIAPEKESAYLDAMEKYDEDWWLSTNPGKLVSYQMRERKLLIPMKIFQNVLEEVLKRPVAVDEIQFTNEALQSEVQEALQTVV